MLKIITIALITFGLYLIHKICLWLESKGWLYYKNHKPEGGIIGNALLELNSLFQPGTKHIIEIKMNNEKEIKQNKKNDNHEKNACDNDNGDKV